MLAIQRIAITQTEWTAISTPIDAAVAWTLTASADILLRTDPNNSATETELFYGDQEHAQGLNSVASGAVICYAQSVSGAQTVTAKFYR